MPQITVIVEYLDEVEAPWILSGLPVVLRLKLHGGLLADGVTQSLTVSVPGHEPMTLELVNRQLAEGIDISGQVAASQRQLRGELLVDGPDGLLTLDIAGHTVALPLRLLPAAKWRRWASSGGTNILDTRSVRISVDPSQGIIGMETQRRRFVWDEQEVAFPAREGVVAAYVNPRHPGSFTQRVVREWNRQQNARIENAKEINPLSVIYEVAATAEPHHQDFARMLIGDEPVIEMLANTSAGGQELADLACSGCESLEALDRAPIFILCAGGHRTALAAWRDTGSFKDGPMCRSAEEVSHLVTKGALSFLDVWSALDGVPFDTAHGQESWHRYQADFCYAIDLRRAWVWRVDNRQFTLEPVPRQPDLVESVARLATFGIPLPENTETN